MTVHQLGQHLSSAELVDWIAYDQIVTPDEWSRHADLCHLIESLAVGKKARRPVDFLPKKYRPKPRKQTAADQKAIIRGAIRGAKKS